MAAWPALPYEEWRETRDTLHMYTQVLGKLRLALSPFEPEWSHVPLYVTSRGLTTSTLPIGLRTVDLELDLIGHELVVRCSDGRIDRRRLGGDVAGFYADVMRILELMRIEVEVSTMPQEVSNPIPFPDDHTHQTYVEEQANQFFETLSRVDLVMKEHRARFKGRTTLVQFYWGTFDLAVTRYSGRSIEPPVDAGLIQRISADAEAICAGWWPGDERTTEPTFFAYGYPSPPGIEAAAIRPEAASWNTKAAEFLLPYEAVRSSPDPRRAIREFLESTYQAAATLMSWDGDLTTVVAPPGPGGLKEVPK